MHAGGLALDLHPAPVNHGPFAPEQVKAAMNAPSFEVALLSWPEALSALARPLRSDLGSFRFVHCDDPTRVPRCDAVLVGAGPQGWEGLADSLVDLAARHAVVLAGAAEPDAAQLERLLAAGVQDILVAPDAATLARSLRLAIERHARESAARQAASIDLLTGLPNQAQLIEHMSQLLALREREPAPMLVMVLRVEGLAAAEASFGREATNALRRKLGVRLRAAIRAGDVIAATAHDRFAVLLPHVQAAGDGPRVAEKLVAALHAPIALAGQSVRVAAAAGIAQYPRDGREPAVLLRVAGDLAAQAPVRAPDAADRNPRPEAANDD